MRVTTVVTVVHEHVHQWAGKQQEIRQRAKDVRRVLGEQVEPADQEDNSQANPGGRAPERRHPIV